MDMERNCQNLPQKVRIFFQELQLVYTHTHRLKGKDGSVGLSVYFPLWYKYGRNRALNGAQFPSG